MENKSDALRREILKSLIDRYAVKGKKVLISKAKDAGVYKGFVSDEEVYSLIVKFAEFHKLPIFFEESVIAEKIIPPAEITKKKDTDYFYSVLQDQHNLLSKQLLALNKLMDTYNH